MFYIQTSVADVTLKKKELGNEKTKSQKEEKPLPDPLKSTRPRRLSPRSSKMDRFDVVKFDDLTGPGGEEWIKIGGGSFGVVFRVSLIRLLIT